MFVEQFFFYFVLFSRAVVLSMLFSHPIFVFVLKCFELREDAENARKPVDRMAASPFRKHKLAHTHDRDFESIKFFVKTHFQVLLQQTSMANTHSGPR